MCNHWKIPCPLQKFPRNRLLVILTTNHIIRNTSKFRNLLWNRPLRINKLIKLINNHTIPNLNRTNFNHLVCSRGIKPRCFRIKYNISATHKIPIIRPYNNINLIINQSKFRPIKPLKMLTRILYLLVVTRYNTISNRKSLATIMISNSNSPITHFNTLRNKFTSMLIKIHPRNTIHLTHHRMSVKFNPLNLSIINNTILRKSLTLRNILKPRIKNNLTCIFIHNSTAIKYKTFPHFNKLLNRIIFLIILGKKLQIHTIAVISHFKRNNLKATLRLEKFHPEHLSLNINIIHFTTNIPN